MCSQSRRFVIPDYASLHPGYSLCCEDGMAAVGLNINANHVRAVREGIVTGTARSLHVGRSTQVWKIRIENEAGELVCIARLTMAVVPRRAVAPKPA